MLYVAAVNLELEERDVYHGYGATLGDGDAGRTGRSRIGSTPGRLRRGMAARSWRWVPTGECRSRSPRVPLGDGRHRRLRPQRRRDLPEKRVGGLVYSAGMSRMVYRRPLNGGRWERADAGARVPRTSTEIAGFLDLDGFDERDLYAVGFQGHIWDSDGARWRRIDSPTNLKLECVRCAEDGRVYIAGAKGIILGGPRCVMGRHRARLDRGDLLGDGVCIGSIYLSTDVGFIYRLDGDALSPIETGLGRRISTRGLYYNDGVLLSTGAHDLCLFDGRGWAEVPHH